MSRISFQGDRERTKRRGEEDCLVVFYLVLWWMQGDIIGKDCFINSQGPRPGSVCGCVAHLGRLLLLLFFSFLWLSVHVWSFLVLSLPGFVLIAGGSHGRCIGLMCKFYLHKDRWANHLPP